MKTSPMFFTLFCVVALILSSRPEAATADVEPGIAPTVAACEGVNVPAGGVALARSDLESWDGMPRTVNDLFGDSLPLGSAVSLWDREIGAYLVESLEESGWVPGTNVVDRGEGFWLKGPADSEGVDFIAYLVGRVPATGSTTQGGGPGLTLLGYPYPKAMMWEDLAAAIAAQPGDKLYQWNSLQQAYDIYTRGDQEWIDTDGLTIPAGEGFLFEAGEAWMGTEECPYEWPKGMEDAPMVTSLGVEDGQVTLTIGLCAARKGTVWEIYACDVTDDPAKNFEGVDSVWTLAETNLVLRGESVEWTDPEEMEGSATRFYALGLAGADIDGDGLCDGRELLIHKTSFTSPDSDGDGVPDGLEVKTGRDSKARAGARFGEEGIDTDETQVRDAQGKTGKQKIYVHPVRGRDSADGFDTLARNGHGPLKTMRSALGKAKAGDTVVLAAGVYAEKLGVISAPGVTIESSVVVR